MKSITGVICVFLCVSLSGCMALSQVELGKAETYGNDTPLKDSEKPEQRERPVPSEQSVQEEQQPKGAEGET